MEIGYSGENGIITIAQGKKRYIDMAVNLAISLRASSPGIPLAVITDSTDENLKKYFDFIIPINPDYGIGLIQKLRIYEYSCFEKTLFIDADCLAVRPVEFLFRLFSGHEISCIGHKRTSGKLFGLEANEIMERFSIPYVIGHNGGVYYFKKGEKARVVFEEAIRLLKEYDSIGIERLRGNINEEPLLAFAMSIHRIEPVDDKGEGMRTPVGQRGVFKIDVLKGYCEFYKYDEKVSPAIMHFGGNYPEAFHYLREVKKLHLVYYYKLSPLIAGFAVNMIYNTSYTVYVFVYRIIKKVLKGGRFSLTPIMPMFRFE
jgi:hypothetical protein